MTDHTTTPRTMSDLAASRPFVVIGPGNVAHSSHRSEVSAHHAARVLTEATRRNHRVIDRRDG